MSESNERQRIFSKSITLGSLLAVLAQAAAAFGLLVQIGTWFSNVQIDVSQVKAGQLRMTQQIDDLLRWRDMTESENNAWRRSVTESLDEYRHRLDRLDWVTNQRVLDREQRMPERGKSQ